MILHWDVKPVFVVAVLLACVVACGDNKDENGQSHGWADLGAEYLTDTGAVHGDVYTCASPAECLGEDGKPASEEWCWRKDDEGGLEAELEARYSEPVDCWPIKASERFFPWLVGCAFRCDPPLDVPGSNAHCGTMCPSKEEG